MLKAADTLETMERLLQLTSDMIQVRPERCVCVRNRHASCTRCSDACTSGAISLVDGTLVVSPDLCVGCGTCATVCPTCALETSHPNDAALLAKARQVVAETASAGIEPTATFACHRALEHTGRIAGEGCVGVVCLSRLEESLITTLFAEGAQVVRAVHADCDNCMRRDGFKSVKLVAQTMDELERVWGLPAAFKVESCDAAWLNDSAQNAAGQDTRADKAASKGQNGKPVLAHAAEQAMLAHVGGDGTLPHFVPVRRGRLLDALATFGDPAEPTLETRLWGHVEIDMSKCRSCRMCTVFCPTGALCKYNDEDGSMGIEHYVAECVHCCLCQDICPAGAIVSHAKVPAMQLAHAEVERYPMPEPEWTSGPDQIVRKMEKKISGNAVTASYSTEIPKDKG